MKDYLADLLERLLTEYQELFGYAEHDYEELPQVVGEAGRELERLRAIDREASGK